MNILSLFGGIECWRVALDRAWIPVDKYFSSEIDPYAIKITQANYPDIVHIGDVKGISCRKLPSNPPMILWWSTLMWKSWYWLTWEKVEIDLLIGGSPCQDLSIAKAWGKWLDWEKSWLFYEYVRILREIKPKYFLLENVASMRQADRDTITEVLREVYPDTEVHMINSALVSAQNRKRLYWTNIPWVKQPEDRWIILRDILEDIQMDDSSWKLLDEKYLTDKVKLQLREKAYPVTATYAWACPRDFLEKNQRQLVIWQFRRWAHLRIHADQENSPTLTSNMGTGGNNVPIILGLTHRNRVEWKQPEFNGQEKVNSMTTVQSDSEVLGIFQIPRGKNAWGIVANENKAPTLTTSDYANNSNVLAEYELEYYWRKLTPIECERLQTLPDGYTAHVSDSRRYKAIWNWWTVDVIDHILSFMK